MITVSCKVCNNSFTTTQQAIDRGRGKYCSRRCYQQHWINHIGPKLKSRTRNRITRICETCGKEFTIIPSWLKNKGAGKYCSRKCKHIGQTKVAGRDHPLYKEKIRLVCNFCGDEYLLKPALASRSKFCSRTCHGSWRSQNMHNRSSIEIEVASMLDDIGVVYREQEPIGKFLCDFFLPNNNLVIEADGIYWHNLPSSSTKDKRKNTYLTNKGYKLLRLPEELINNSPDTCKELILDNLRT